MRMASLPVAPRTRRAFQTLTVATLLGLSLCTTAWSQLQPIPQDRGASGYGLALRRLGVVGSLLYVTAHPDDENNALLVKVSRGLGIRTGLLTLTRGDGGQNEIGPELFQAIGILRSEELLAIHRYDGARQFFTRAYEFGYSFSVEETFRKWGKEEILGDLVRTIRTFRPQVILTLSPEGDGGGQHHQASAILAAEAFSAAADPSLFPEQIEKEGLLPWAAPRLFRSAGFGGGRTDDEPPRMYVVSLDDFDPLLGESYGEFGARARSNHRCQGMNILPNPSANPARYLLAGSNSETPPEGTDFFQGLPTGLELIARLEPALQGRLSELQERIDQANRLYAVSDYSGSVREVMSGLRVLRLALEEAEDSRARDLLELEVEDFGEAAAKGHFLYFDALARGTRDGTVVPGQIFEVAVQFLDRSSLVQEFDLEILAPEGWNVAAKGEERGRHLFEVEVASDARFSQPYWRLSDPLVDRYDVATGYTGMEPFAPPALVARVRYQSGGVAAWLETPVQYRWYDAQAGVERRMEIKVVPAISVEMAPAVAVVSSRIPQPKELLVTVQNNHPGEAQGTVRLEAPAGWTASPASRPVSFQYENERSTVRFRMVPAERLAPASLRVGAVVESGGREYRQGYQVIAYHHIQTRHLYHPAETRLQVIDYGLPAGLEVGYVMGVGDEVALASEQLGAKVTYLTAEDLASADLSRFDSIVVGVRAYLNRGDLVANNQRLLDYVREGGHLIVQWNKFEFNQEQFAPYPAKVTSPPPRISVEESPVRVLRPEHAIFTRPNEIGEEDWTGWVQERGTYMLGEWDPAFVELIEMEDPWPYNEGPKRGGLLVVKYGKGTYTSAGLAFFRQLPAGVPGAYRLWANILSHGRFD